MDLLTSYTHRSELQVITALSLISTFYKSPQHPLSHFPTCYVFNSRSLATSSNSGDFSASRAHVVTVRRISRNWTLLNCQLNYSVTSSQPPLQSSTQLLNLNSLTHQPTTSLNWLADNSNQQLSAIIWQLTGSQAGGHFTPTSLSSLHRLNWTLSLTNQLLHLTSLNWTADNCNQQLIHCFKLSCL
jgi:hypothetical protein